MKFISNWIWKKIPVKNWLYQPIRLQGNARPLFDPNIEKGLALAFFY